MDCHRVAVGLEKRQGQQKKGIMAVADSLWRLEGTLGSVLWHRLKLPACKR